MALKLPGILGKILKVLSKIADIAIKGREAGLWQKGHAPKDFPVPQSFVGMPAETIPVSNGMSNILAAGWATFIGIAMAALQATLQGLDWSAVINDPKIILPAFLAAFATAWSHRLQRPGQASVMLGSSAEVRKEAETLTSLKIDVPLRVDGGK